MTPEPMMMTSKRIRGPERSLSDSVRLSVFGPSPRPSPPGGRGRKEDHVISAIIILVSALFVVRSSNLIHAVLWLAMTLLGTAALYAQLNAPFLAGVQVLTYVGGVVTLMIFGVMVTRRHAGSVAPAERVSNVRGALAAEHS